jgi:hypothetical protein
MNSSKCLHCGLVNFADATTCKRCGAAIADSSQTPEFQGFNQPPVQPAATFGSPQQAPIKPQSASLWENAGFRKIIFGVCWIVGGLILTQFTSFIFYGAIIFGGIDVLRGVVGLFTDMDG